MFCYFVAKIADIPLNSARILLKCIGLKKHHKKINKLPSKSASKFLFSSITLTSLPDNFQLMGYVFDPMYGISLLSNLNRSWVLAQTYIRSICMGSDLQRSEEGIHVLD